MSKAKVSIVVLNWNGKEHLKDCLPSIISQSYNNFEIILVDNGSSDGSVEYVKQNYKNIYLIENKENLGFCKANNIGIKCATGKYIATINNDTKMDKNWIKSMVELAENSPKEIGMLSCKMLFFDQPEKINSIGLKLYCDGHAIDEGMGESKNTYIESKEVFGPCGGATFYKKEMLDDINLDGDYFDSDFFIYSDDLDLAFRARLRGWKCIYNPNAIIYHKFRATCGKISNFGLFYGIKNKIFFIIKNYPLKTIIINSPTIILRQFVSFVYYLFKLNPAAFKSRMLIFAYFPKMLNKRKQIQSKKKISNKEIDYWLAKRSFIKSLFYKE